MKNILKPQDSIEDFKIRGGGKATNLAKLQRWNCPVPSWFCIGTQAFQRFIAENKLVDRLTPNGNWDEFELHVESLFLAAPLPLNVQEELHRALVETQLIDSFVSVRSSGLDEDSAEHSFAGQYSSFLYQKGLAAIHLSIKRCWASAFSARAMTYRVERGLPLSQVQLGVIIQLMVNADAAGVSFSRNPMKPLERETMIVSSVWGLGEGLVSGQLDADHFEVSRRTLQAKYHLARKTHAFVQGRLGGLQKISIPIENHEKSSLTPEQLETIAAFTLSLEQNFGCPQDIEWAVEKNVIFILQARPITTLPPDAFFQKGINGDHPVLWDNSNIIESYSGVTSPLTFSFANYAYRQVYIQFCQIVGVPQKVILANEPMFRNMLGLLRGRIYYNLMNWYRIVLFLPGAANNKDFMETMMGVKQKLDPQVMELFENLEPAVHHSLFKRVRMGITTFYRFLRINKIIGDFNKNFLAVYEEIRRLPFSDMSLSELRRIYQKLDDEILRRWHAPIINDYLCMIFFGVLKKLTGLWLGSDASSVSLQNDLLCGEGSLESTEPTKLLMRLAEKIDQHYPEVRDWMLSSRSDEIWKCFKNDEGISLKVPEIRARLIDFLDQYGFRCINELKLEEPDLHDNPEFIINAIVGYIRGKSYSIASMEERERLIRREAEEKVCRKLPFLKRIFFFWIVKQTRIAVKNRENLRFARTKIFGIARHLFRGIGEQFARLGILQNQSDIFYLTNEEILSFIEGRSVTLDLGSVAEIRKKEFKKFKQSSPPPDRLVTKGAVGSNCKYAQILQEFDLLRNEEKRGVESDLLTGTPCCPGVVEGVVRLAETARDAEGMNGEILVTARTDPGWVPLFPSCAGLLIERGSLLSHSAVVARELGLPTIVGINGGLMKKLKSGQKVRIDAGKGEVRILA